MNRKPTPPPPGAVPTSLRAAALALVFGAAAQAQEAPAAGSADQVPAAAETTLPAIKATAARERDNSVGTTGGKFESALRDIPQSVTVVDRKMLDSQAAASLKDALRNVPGITLGAGEGGVIGDNINLRGYSARSDIFLDGLRDRGQYSRDVFSLQAVEVLKGPSSMLFGRGSTGGVINQIAKKPDLRSRAEVGVTVGTGGHARGSADINRKLTGTTAARLALYGQDLQSTRDVVRNQDWGLAPSIRFGIDTPTEITLAALVQRNRDLPDYGFPLVADNAAGGGVLRRPVQAPGNVYYGYSDDHFNQSVNVLSAVVEHRFSPAARLRNSTLASANRTDASPSPLGPVARAGGGTPSAADALTLLSAPRQDRERVLLDKSLINQTDLQFKLASGSMRHTLTTGVEIGRESSRDDRYVWNTSAANAAVNLGRPVVGPRSGSHALTRSTTTTADTLAVYVNDQVELNPLWQLVAGLRGERFKVRSGLVKMTVPPGFPVDTTVASAPKSETLSSPRAGLIFQPAPAQSYYLSWGTSFNPSAETVTQSTSTAALDAEKSRALEAGARLDLLGGDLALSAAAFRTDKTNARFRDGTNNAVQVLGGLVRVQGLEVGLTGNLTSTWQVFGGYTLLDGRIVRSTDIGSGADAGIAAQGKTAPNTPRHNATLWTTARLAPQWQVGGGLLHSSSRTLNNYATAVIAGYTRLDATVAYVQKSFELRLNLQNLADRLYFEGSNAGRATPVRGRTVLASALYRY
jgi:catecholate siderophore receptor